MTLTLVVESATSTGTVAVLDGAKVLAMRESALRGANEERLLPAVAGALDEARARIGDVGRVVCGAGPGSFTSLRIGAALAKGIATVRRAPLYAVSSPALIVAGNVLPDGRYVAAIDALRGELFFEALEQRGEAVVSLSPPRRARREEVEREARELDASLVGPSEPGRRVPRAAGVARLLDWLDRDGPVSLASWEPDYGRLAEAQVRWERAHGRPLAAS